MPGRSSGSGDQPHGDHISAIMLQMNLLSRGGTNDADGPDGQWRSQGLIWEGVLQDLSLPMAFVADTCLIAVMAIIEILDVSVARIPHLPGPPAQLASSGPIALWTGLHASRIVISA